MFIDENHIVSIITLYPET